MTKRAQNTSKKVNRFYECTIIVTLKWIYCNICSVSIIWTVQLNVRLKDRSKCVVTFIKKSDT